MSEQNPNQNNNYRKINWNKSLKLFLLKNNNFSSNYYFPLIVSLIILITTAVLIAITLIISRHIIPLEGAIDPDERRDALGLIASRGFIPEVYHILTSDGYVLELHRIVNPLLERPGNRMTRFSRN